MNKKKYGFVIMLLLAIGIVSVGLTGLYVRNENIAKEKERITVVTSFYPMYIATLNVIDGCDNVNLKNLSEPQTGCLHDYQLSPEDMVTISEADVFVVNGGHVEHFLSDVKEAYPELPIIEAGEEVEMLGDNGHVWLHTEAYRAQVMKIAKELGAIDTDNEKIYMANAEAYCDRIAEVEHAYHELKHHSGVSVIILHEGYEYIASEWGMHNAYTLNLDEERKVSAGEVAAVLEAIQDNQVEVILAEEQYGSKMAQTIQGEAEVQVIYLDTCVRGDYEKDAYIQAMSKNLELITEALHHEEDN